MNYLSKIQDDEEYEQPKLTEDQMKPGKEPSDTDEHPKDEDKFDLWRSWKNMRRVMHAYL